MSELRSASDQARRDAAPARGRRDVRPLALAAAGWAAMGVATSADAWWWIAAAGVATAVVLVGAARHAWFWVGLGLVALLFGAVGALRVGGLTHGPVLELAQQEATAAVQVRLVGSARSWPQRGVRPPLWVGSATLIAVEARGGAWATGLPVEVVASGDLAAQWEGLAVGSLVAAEARLAPGTPGEAALVVVRAREPPRLTAPPGPVDAGVNRIRAGLREACASLSPDARALVPALVVGDVSGMTEELTEPFRVTGLTHLTAVSGANLTLLLVFVRAVAVWGGARGRVLTGVMVAGVVAFVAVCLGEPSVVRAAAMGLVGLGGLGRGAAEGRGVRYLASAVLVVVLVDPWLSRSVGFWLSVLATFGLLWWGRRFTDALGVWLPRWAAEAVAVALAAQVATEPVVVWLAGRVSVVGVLANVVVAPLVGPATVLGVVAAVAAPLGPGVAVGAAWLAGWCAQAIAWVARLGAALPGAALPFPATPVALGCVLVICVLVVVVAPRVLARWWLTVPLGALVVVSLAWTPVTPGWPAEEWAVVVCDVGQGDATVVNAGGGAAVVVDAGPDPAALGTCLAGLGVRSVPLVVITHLHADHVGGVSALSGLGPQVVVTSAVRTPASGDALVESLGVERHTARAGESWLVGEARVEVLASPGQDAVGLVQAGGGESSGENDASLLVRVEVGGVSVLLAGDVETGGQGARLGLGERLDVDVLLVPHHGSGRQDPAFLAAASPDVALVSVGEGNGYGHPAARTLDAVAGTGAVVARTDLQGSLGVARVEGRLELTTQRAGG
ncbi:ComEC/Rec2 family competence protein [Propioniciclava soli]|uniref:ComEC/Rec2 family competence protein n=1 Tax=Propioniciclava soli TaxID=2775081 RepID=A0ABZ3C441_9ACTN